MQSGSLDGIFQSYFQKNRFLKNPVRTIFLLK
jgi:hypothetical protein